MEKCLVEIRVIKPGARASAFTDGALAMFTREGEDLVLKSPLDPAVTVSDHLKWLHNMLKLERKRLRKLQEDGLVMICNIQMKGRGVSIEPEALLLMHQSRLRTDISFGH